MSDFDKFDRTCNP